MKVLNITKKYEAPNYPYGRLRTSAYFSIDFKPGKGFRSIFQTLNPKNGRMNAEKRSTYSHLAWIELNEVNMHYETNGMNFSGFENVKKGCDFITEHQGELCLTPEMMKEIACTMIGSIKASAHYMECDTEALLAIIEQPIKKLIHIFKTGENAFNEVELDVAGINALKETELKQERFVSSGPIALSSMMGRTAL